MAERDQLTGAAAGLPGPGLPAGCEQIPVLARRVGQSLVVIMHVINTALGTVLRSLGWDARPFGEGGAWLILLPGADGTDGAAS